MADFRFQDVVPSLEPPIPAPNPQAQAGFLDFATQGQKRTVVGTDHGEGENFVYGVLAQKETATRLKEAGYTEVRLEVDARFKPLFDEAPHLTATQFADKYIASYPPGSDKIDREKLIAMHGAITNLSSQGIKVIPDDERFASLADRAAAVHEKAARHDKVAGYNDSGDMQSRARQDMAPYGREHVLAVLAPTVDAVTEKILLDSPVADAYVTDSKDGLAGDPGIAKDIMKQDPSGKSLKVVGAEHIEMPCGVGPQMQQAPGGGDVKTMRVVSGDPVSAGGQTLLPEDRQSLALDAMGRSMPDAILNSRGGDLLQKKDYYQLSPRVPRTTALVGKVCP